MPRGRFAIFQPREGGRRIQGELTKVGTADFEKARAALARTYQRIVGRALNVPVSDADTAEALARGYKKTVQYLRTLK